MRVDIVRYWGGGGGVSIWPDTGVRLDKTRYSQVL